LVATPSPLLTVDQIEQFVEALRMQGAPVVERLAAGLTAPEMDDITRPLGLSLPVEARTWWGCHNGVSAPQQHGHGSVLAIGAWWWAPLEVVVADCQELRRLSDPSMWSASWLPIVIGDGVLVVDTAVQPGARCPVHDIDFEGD
jgi:hypothetical protein